MEFQDIAARMREHLGDAVASVEEAVAAPDPAAKEKKDGPRDPVVHVEPGAILEVCRFLKEDPELRFDLLLWVAGLDHLDPKDEAGGAFTVVYHFLSTLKNHRLTVKARVPRNDPRIATVSKLYPAAGWHERETYDFFGIVFEGHEDPRRILCPEDWEGHALRKDYVFPREYHGICAE